MTAVGVGDPLACLQAADMPGVARSDHTVAFDAETMTAAYGTLQLLVLRTQAGP